MRNAHGRYTDKQVKRASRIVGCVGEEIEQIFDCKVANTAISERKRSKKKIKNSSVSKFVATYKKNNLFANITGRSHKGFENFVHQIKIKNRDQLLQRMYNYTKVVEDEDFILH